MKRSRKITFRLKDWHIWLMVNCVAVVGIVEIICFAAYQSKATVSYYEGLIIPRLLIGEQNKIIDLQAKYIEELKAKNSTLKTAYDQKSNDYDTLVESFENAYKPFLETLGASPIVVGGHIYVSGPNGLNMKK
jgi:hypothetical protein